jgi:hypothetical protein
VIQCNQEGVEVKRLVTVVSLAILPAALILFGLNDLNVSIADTNTYADEAKRSVSKPGRRETSGQG